MRKRTGLIVLVSLLLVTAAAGRADTIYTATGHPVTVYHYGYCGPNGCPAPDSTFEAYYGFRSADRWYSGTGAWNCHGRTFDNRQGWIPYAEPWMSYDAPVCPASPRPGDTVIWWLNGYTAHSVTITGSWNGLSTTVMSKYGTQGQYQHALSNPILVYGSNWSVIRFTAGTTIYWYGVRPGETSTPETSMGAHFLEQRQAMPWNDTVKASALLYATEHPLIVARSTALRDTTRAALRGTESPEEQATVLVRDLADPAHYVALMAFNGPQFTEEFVTGIEAGKLLALLVEQHPDVRPVVVEQLTALVKAPATPDPTRGAAVYFLGKIVPADEASGVKGELTTEEPTAVKVQPGIITYMSYYLQKLAPQDN